MTARIRIVSVVATLVCLGPVAARSQDTWAKVLGHWGYFVSGARSAPTSDGGCVVVGRVPSFGANKTDGLIVKLRADGKVQWQKMLGGRWWDVFEDVLQTGDGGYLAVGTHYPSPSTGDLWAVQFDSDGSVLWQRTFAFAKPGEWDAWSEPIVRELPGGGFLVASFGTVVRLDADGAAVWAKTYALDDAYIESIEDFRLTPDGGLVLLLEGARAGTIVKLDSAGVIEWARRYKSQELGYGRFGRLLALADGGYLLVGSNPDYAAVLTKVNGKGDVQWSYSYEGFTMASWDTGLFESVDGSVRIGGSTPSIISVDAAGQFLWGREYRARYSGQNDANGVTLEPGSAGGMFFSISRRKADFHLELESNIVVLQLAADGSISSCPDLVQDFAVTREDLKVMSVPVTPSYAEKSLVVTTPVTTVWKAGLLVIDLCETGEE
ncbi:MAG: hypothetical protein HYX75_15300 [Acidobacteria bacterium]|nr:hypothetical protein [Acidobacteriota bacterium]